MTAMGYVVYTLYAGIGIPCHILMPVKGNQQQHGHEYAKQYPCKTISSLFNGRLLHLVCKSKEIKWICQMVYRLFAKS